VLSFRGGTILTVTFTGKSSFCEGGTANRPHQFVETIRTASSSRLLGSPFSKKSISRPSDCLIRRSASALGAPNFSNSQQRRSRAVRAVTFSGAYGSSSLVRGGRAPRRMRGSAQVWQRSVQQTSDNPQLIAEFFLPRKNSLTCNPPPDIQFGFFERRNGCGFPRLTRSDLLRASKGVASDSASPRMRSAGTPSWRPEEVWTCERRR
jgi:hypothetical protein